jgi:hypothetical protein
MPGIQLSNHASDMLAERSIREDGVWQTINAPSQTWRGPDGNFHYAKQISEKRNYILHVIVDDEKDPQRVVTVLFDRRLQR